MSEANRFEPWTAEFAWKDNGWDPESISFKLVPPGLRFNDVASGCWNGMVLGQPILVQREDESYEAFEKRAFARWEQIRHWDRPWEPVPPAPEAEEENKETSAQ